MKSKPLRSQTLECQKRLKCYQQIITVMQFKEKSVGLCLILLLILQLKYIKFSKNDSLLKPYLDNFNRETLKSSKKSHIFYLIQLVIQIQTVQIILQYNMISFKKYQLCQTWMMNLQHEYFQNEFKKNLKECKICKCISNRWKIQKLLKKLKYCKIMKQMKFLSRQMKF
ncbi:unnamed protein product [Paramecium octaurelia]|uniref:Uncharacterized protein n=1 Tax=Paramecium octaurelia TaxID=43137 RepID=A0A8S1X1Q5_PAROT|nr:unnamed protein product [Paramecium octaurelia]